MLAFLLSLVFSGTQGTCMMMPSYAILCHPMPSATLSSHSIVYALFLFICLYIFHSCTGGTYTLSTAEVSIEVWIEVYRSVDRGVGRRVDRRVYRNVDSIHEPPYEKKEQDENTARQKYTYRSLYIAYIAI